MGYSKTFFIPEAKGLTTDDYLHMRQLHCIMCIHKALCEHCIMSSLVNYELDFSYIHVHNFPEIEIIIIIHDYYKAHIS